MSASRSLIVRSAVVAGVVVLGSGLIAFAFGGAQRTASQVAATSSSPQVSATPSSPPWWYSSGVSACGMSGMYRANGVVYRLGDCAGNLIDPPAAVTVRVGQEVDVAMTEETGVSGSLVPVYPVPSSSDDSVLRRVAVADGGASATFRAEAPGTAVLTTSGSCVNTESLQQTQGACPVLAVTVTAATPS